MDTKELLAASAQELKDSAAESVAAIKTLSIHEMKEELKKN